VTTTRAAADPAPPPEPVPEPAAPPEPAGPAAGSPALSQLSRIVGGIVAPTTLLTSLLVFFGWSHAFWFFNYFGINATLLDLTTQDYLRRSRDGLFIPMTVVACAGLLGLWGHAMLRDRLGARSGPGRLGLLVPATAAAGLLLAAGGLWSVFAPTPLSRYLAVAPLCLAGGVLLVEYAVHLRRLLATPERRPRPAGPVWAAVAHWAAVFVLVGLSLFWAASDYSAAVGEGRARQVVAELPSYPGAVVYSERSLSLRAPGVRETRCQDPEAAYRYRYHGLKLVLQSGGQYLFLPQGWSPSEGVAILMPRSDSLRLEFRPAAAGDPPPAC
jgi:hypothetical protein